MYRWLSVGRCQRAASPASVSTRSSLRLCKQLSFSPKLRRVPFLPLSSSVVQSDLTLYNPKQKFLSIPNPVYFQQRHYSSSSNHTDNEDSAQEDVVTSPVVEEQRRRRNVRRKAASWWCLNKADHVPRQQRRDSSDEDLDVFQADSTPFCSGRGKPDRRLWPRGNVEPAWPRVGSAESRSRRLLSNLKLSFLNHVQRNGSRQSLAEKPLVFGGTFPIDAPLDDFPEVPRKVVTRVKRPTVRTFAIDEPITASSWEPRMQPSPVMPRSQPLAETFNIDEPYSISPY